MKTGIELAIDQLADLRTSLLATITYLQSEADFAPTRTRRNAASDLVRSLRRAQAWLPEGVATLSSVGTKRLSHVAVKCEHCEHEDDAHLFLRDDRSIRQCPRCEVITRIDHGHARTEAVVRLAIECAGDHLDAKCCAGQAELALANGEDHRAHEWAVESLKHTGNLARLRDISDGRCVMDGANTAKTPRSADVTCTAGSGGV